MREIQLPAAELLPDGPILKTWSAATLREGLIEGTFSIGMGGYLYVTVGTSSKDGRTLLVKARKCVPIDEYHGAAPVRDAAAFYAVEPEIPINYAGLMVECNGVRYVLEDELIIIPTKEKAPEGVTYARTTQITPPQAPTLKTTPKPAPPAFKKVSVNMREQQRLF